MEVGELTWTFEVRTGVRDHRVVTRVIQEFLDDVGTGARTALLAVNTGIDEVTLTFETDDSLEFTRRQFRLPTGENLDGVRITVVSCR